MRIDDIFNEKLTQNGDKAFYSTNSQYLDTILRFDFYKKNPDKIPVFLNPESEFDKYFARMIRDPRRNTGGFGGRALGRELLRQVKAEPSEILVSGNDYASDTRALSSFGDASNTNFGRVMEQLSRATEDLPDWLVVLSDMEFDEGSANSKDEAMEKLRRYNPNLKIVWWNLSSIDTTTPETDKYGNVFMGGYNANLLKLLKAGFDADMFLKTLVENYKKNIENK